MLQIMG